MKSIGIVGFGEVGQALAALYEEKGFTPLIKDLERDDQLEGCDILNITFPYCENFVEETINHIKEIKPKSLVIIHSTVAPGTTAKLYNTFNNTAHSPVRGVHPNLLKGLKEFVKVVGGRGAEDAYDHLFYELNLDVTTYGSSNATEVAKLLDTSYYGLCIAFHDYADKLCKGLGVEFEDVMTHYNESYNEGYINLGMRQVVRPVLDPPDGPIGGHCIVDNAEILRGTCDSVLLEGITKLK